MEGEGRVEGARGEPKAAAVGASGGSGFLATLQSVASRLRVGDMSPTMDVPISLFEPRSTLERFENFLRRPSLLEAAAAAGTPLERMLGVISFVASTYNQEPFLKPYNPVLGELHTLSRGSAELLIEQVSHHPPVTALSLSTPHATALVQEHPRPRFTGVAIELVLREWMHLQLHLGDAVGAELYEVGSPAFRGSLFPRPSTEWIGQCEVRCRATGLRCVLNFAAAGLFKGAKNALKGKVYTDGVQQPIRKLKGTWTGVLEVWEPAETARPKSFSAKALSALRGKRAGNGVHEPSRRVLVDLSPSEAEREGVAVTVHGIDNERSSARVWSAVSDAIRRGDMSAAKKRKEEVEIAARQRLASGEAWIPRHFGRVAAEETSEARRLASRSGQYWVSTGTR